MRWTRLSIYYLPLLHGALCLWVMNPHGLEPISDEPVYVSLAKSLATTGTYNSVFLPGDPAHAKYPFLFPWLLSQVWRIAPEYPSNVVALRLLNIAVGMAFLAVLGAMLFASKACSNLIAFCILLICSFHPAVIANSISLHSEAAFSLFTCLGIWVLLQWDGEKGGLISLLVGGFFFGCAFYVRSAGLALAAGFLCHLLSRYRWREAFVWSALTLTLIFPWLYWELAHNISTYFPEYIFYGSYLSDFIKLIRTQGLLKFLAGNLFYLAIGIPKLLLFPFQTNLRFITHVTMWVGFPLLFIMAKGTIRSCPKGFELVRWYLFSSLLMLLLWPYPAGERMLSPLLPFFYLFLLTEGVKLAQPRKEASEEQPQSISMPRLLPGILSGCAVLGIVCLMIHTVSFLRSNLQHNRAFESSELEMRESFAWIIAETLPSDFLMANFDPLYYLHTGRKTAPMSFEYARKIDEPKFDVSPIRKHRIRYLIVGEHDFEVFTPDIVELMQKELQAVLRGRNGMCFLRVFESSHRKYVIYRIWDEKSPLVAGA
jgi:hypothetical protein